MEKSGISDPKNAGAYFERQGSASSQDDRNCSLS